jgi:hypothetical protein
MPGSKIPVLQVEKLEIKNNGRGIHVFNDGVTLYSGGSSTWTGVSSQCSGASKKFLVAASATAWLKVCFASGTVAGSGAGYIPIFPNVDNTAWK